jgi:hypothetical protein
LKYVGNVFCRHELRNQQIFDRADEEKWGYVGAEIEAGVLWNRLT